MNRSNIALNSIALMFFQEIVYLFLDWANIYKSGRVSEIPTSGDAQRAQMTTKDVATASRESDQKKTLSGATVTFLHHLLKSHASDQLISELSQDLIAVLDTLVLNEVRFCAEVKLLLL